MIDTAPLLDVKFKNLKIGYYFIFENNIYLKNNDYSAIQIYCMLDIPHFAKTPTRYKSVDPEGNYHRPSNIQVSFEPDNIIKFIKRQDIKNYIAKEFKTIKSTIKFKDLPIGSFFLLDKKYYQKLSYKTAMPIYKNKFGLENYDENIIISSISSGTYSYQSCNGMYYNSEKLIDYKLQSLNVVWFEHDFKSFQYESFDTYKHYNRDSGRLITFLDNIPDGALTFITTSSDLQRADNYNQEGHKFFHISKILQDYPDSIRLFLKFGINDNIINDISLSMSLLSVSRKNESSLHFDRKPAYQPEYRHLLRENIKPYVLEYDFIFNLTEKSFVSGNTFQVIDLEKDVYSITNQELTMNLLYDISDTDPRTFSKYNIYTV